MTAPDHPRQRQIPLAPRAPSHTWHRAQFPEQPVTLVRCWGKAGEVRRSQPGTGRTWKCPLATNDHDARSVARQFELGGEELLHRLNGGFMRCFVIPDVRSAFDTCIIETIGRVSLAVEEDSIF